MEPTHAIALPEAIATYQDAHDRHDDAVALAQFAPDAVVVDDGHTYTGHDEIDRFLHKAASEYTFTRTLIGATEIAPGEWNVTNHIEGNFPGGTVDLNYRFSLDGDHITRLDIAP